jgi:4-diphosphocytidyl-2-C-methyl-D-erythritol kinase
LGDGVDIHAPAKVNLGLRVLRKRSDGYHEILSVLQTVDLRDRLRFERAPTGTTEIVCDHPSIPTDEGNLIWQTAERLRADAGVREGMRVVVEKAIPAGGGLGGGSADAAATLVALNEMWGLGLPTRRLARLASALGSDVPFMLQRGTAIARGRGERLQPVRMDGDRWFVLLDPGFRVSTRWAYSNLGIGLTGDCPYCTLLNSVGEGGYLPWSELLSRLRNDFLPLLMEHHPEVRECLSALEDSGAEACSLSGSGSTLYGVFASEKSAAGAVHQLAERGFAVTLCRPDVD